MDSIFSSHEIFILTLMKNHKAALLLWKPEIFLLRSLSHTLGPYPNSIQSIKHAGTDILVYSDILLGCVNLFAAMCIRLLHCRISLCYPLCRISAGYLYAIDIQLIGIPQQLDHLFLLSQEQFILKTRATVSRQTNLPIWEGSSVKTSMLHAFPTWKWRMDAASTKHVCLACVWAAQDCEWVYSSWHRCTQVKRTHLV